MTQFHTVLLNLYLADPATFLASDFKPYFPQGAACLFSYGKNDYV